MIDKSRMGKNFEGQKSVHILIEVLSGNWYGGTEEYNENLQSGYQIIFPKF